MASTQRIFVGLALIAAVCAICVLRFHGNMLLLQQPLPPAYLHLLDFDEIVNTSRLQSTADLFLSYVPTEVCRVDPECKTRGSNRTALDCSNTRWLTFASALQKLDTQLAKHARTPWRIVIGSDAIESCEALSLYLLPILERHQLDTYVWLSSINDTRIHHRNGIRYAELANPDPHMMISSARLCYPVGFPCLDANRPRRTLPTALRHMRTEWFPWFGSKQELAEQPEWQRYLDYVYGMDTLTFPLETALLFLIYTGDPPHEAPVPTVFRDAFGLWQPGRAFDMYHPQSWGQPYRLPWPANPGGHGWKDEGHRESAIMFHMTGSTVSQLDQRGMHKAWRIATSPILAMYPMGVPLIQNKYLEITHQCCDRPALGFWMYWAPGSGVYYDVGKSLVFRRHTEAYAWFMNCTEIEADRARGASIDTFDGVIVKSAHRLGYDSIQFLDHDQDWAFSFYEVVDLRTYWMMPENMTKGFEKGCPATQEMEDLYFRGGWQASRPCPCRQVKDAYHDDSRAGNCRIRCH